MCLKIYQHAKDVKLTSEWWRQNTESLLYKAMPCLYKTYAVPDCYNIDRCKSEMVHLDVLHDEYPHKMHVLVVDNGLLFIEIFVALQIFNHGSK